jgi:HD-GYP domain-containing protein (c-di-GMP phosphodiesterase class II)
MQNIIQSAPTSVGVNDGTFFSIPIESLMLNSVTRFELYFQPAPNRPYVLYRKGDVPFTVQARKRLLENNLTHLYIRQEDEESYREYIEEHLPELLLSDEVRPHEKAEILYSSAKLVVGNVLQHPKSKQHVQRGRKMVRTSVDFMFDDHNAFRNLVKMLPDDYYLYSHSVNVVAYAVALARHVGHENKAIVRELCTGCMLMDVGMVRVQQVSPIDGPSLTEEERTLVEGHPVIGHTLLDTNGGVGEIALDIVQHHHEKLDGTGYPNGLKGDQISEFVRIASICDVFDALTTSRPYHEAFNTFEALRIMHEDMAGHLDPGLFRSFVELMGDP